MFNVIVLAFNYFVKMYNAERHFFSIILYFDIATVITSTSFVHLENLAT